MVRTCRTVARHRVGDARTRRRAVDLQRACAAYAVLAAEIGARQPLAARAGNRRGCVRGSTSASTGLAFTVRTHPRHARQPFHGMAHGDRVQSDRVAGVIAEVRGADCAAAGLGRLRLCRSQLPWRRRSRAGHLLHVAPRTARVRPRSPGRRSAPPMACGELARLAAELPVAPAAPAPRAWGSSHADQQLALGFSTVEKSPVTNFDRAAASRRPSLTLR